ncbi:MAG: hypothetical protein MJZ13_02715 [Bacteroidales bacterium]|nr:hypothetical protein [Bacteroidales bacterium]
MNNILSIIASIASIVALFLYLYDKFARKKKLRCIVRTYPLLKSGVPIHEQMKLSFKDKEIKNLFCSKVTIWNDGKHTIRYSDLVEKHLSVKNIDNGSILDAGIDKITDESNKIKLSPNRNITLDHLEPKDGAVFLIYHTGTNISIEGKVLDGKFLIDNNSDWHNKHKRKIRRLRRLSNYLKVLILTIYFGCALYYYLTYWGIIAFDPKPMTIEDYLKIANTFFIAGLIIVVLHFLSKLDFSSIPQKLK